MSLNKITGQLLFMSVVCGFANVKIGGCTYVVESRRTREVTVDPVYPHHTSGPCDIADRLKDRWTLVGRPKDKLRIRGNSMIVKYRTTKLRYKCLENRGNTFFLGTTGYLSNRLGVLCLGFAQIVDHPVAEYNIIRLNAHGPEHHLLSPQIIPDSNNNNNTFPSLNATCVLQGSNRDQLAYIKRTERRCSFPEDLQRMWNYTYHSARHVMFSRKTFTMNIYHQEVRRFSCNVKDGDLYVLRSVGFSTPLLDGIICMNITKLLDDPYYAYEMSRLNSGSELDGQVKLFKAGKPVSLREDCDWIDSPARPEFLY